jgi:hypothetical protein
MKKVNSNFSRLTDKKPLRVTSLYEVLRGPLLTREHQVGKVRRNFNPWEGSWLPVKSRCPASVRKEELERT